jgi:hypothetical protein
MHRGEHRRRWTRRQSRRSREGPRPHRNARAHGGFRRLARPLELAGCRVQGLRHTPHHGRLARRLARLRGRACRNWHGFGLRAGAALLAAALLGAGGALPVSAAASSDSVARGADTRGDSAANPPIVLYLARRHWHIDVGFSVSDLNPSLAFIARRFPRARYVFFGFGDRHYLLSKRKGSSSLSGALIPGPGIILVTALENTPTQAFGASQVLEFDLSAVETAAAQSFVRRTLSGEQGMTEIPSVADGPYEGSLYLGGGNPQLRGSACAHAACAAGGSALEASAQGRCARSGGFDLASGRPCPPIHTESSVAGRRAAVLTNDRRGRAWRHNHRSLLRRRRARAADAAGQQSCRHHRTQ